MASIRPSPEDQGRYVRVNGLNMYYEEHGSGEPLVLLHGGTVTMQMWGQQITPLSEHFRVVTPDIRGHGNTDNPTGEFGYRLLADDTAEFIRALGLRQPLICGWSDGGQIALELGMRYPGLVKALVVGAAWYRFSEAYRATLRGMGFEGPGMVDFEQVERGMSHLIPIWQEWHAPRGADYWKTLLPQISTMWMTPLNYTEADFRKIEAPTLVLTGDRDDLIPLEEAVDMYRLISHSELAVVPGSDHGLPLRRAEAFTNVVLDFCLRQSAIPEPAEAGED